MIACCGPCDGNCCWCCGVSCGCCGGGSCVVFSVVVILAVFLLVVVFAILSLRLFQRCVFSFFIVVGCCSNLCWCLLVVVGTALLSFYLI